ncbi:MAG TPA: DUF885 domain-containing protein, partial [Acidimicrobiales bacterium]|nr:DUF885 domain-containing protein [Acidimicrobiales bacterium]
RDPITATNLGVRGYDHLLPTYTSERWASDAEFMKATLAGLATVPVGDDLDRICAAVITERLECGYALASTGEPARTWGVLTSPVSDVRQVFELMADETEDDRATIEARLRQVRPCLASWREGLDDLATRGELPPRRHVLGVASQAAVYAEGAYERFVHGRAGAPTDDALEQAARDADAACGEVAEFLRGLAPKATEHEPCGAERHGRWAQYFTGAALDLHELYEWGWQDLTRINARMWELAADLLPGATSLAAVAAHCDADDAGAVFGTDALLERLESFTQDAVRSLNGVHFDIDPSVQRCDARLAPEGSAAAPYYIAPTEDLSRPGTTWYPTLGRDRFPWWRIASTWYHEAVPGHHLQHAVSLLASDRLSRYQQSEAWTSGYGEGWALYAERL